MTSAADVAGWLVRRLRRAPYWPSRKRSSASLRVMTWNIHHGADPSGHLDLERIAAIIARVQPDVVGLQELDRHWGERSAGQDQPAWLAHRLGMHAAFGATVVRRRAGGPDQEYGIALLGREPWSHVQHSQYPPVGRLEPRGYLVATSASGGLRICCTHLSSGGKATAGQARKRQVAHLIPALRASRPPPPLVVGDFNASGLARPLLAMRRHWVDAVWQAGAGRTSTLVGSPRRLDYVWVDPSWAVEQAVVIQTAVSDHRPVVVDVRQRGDR